MEGEDVISLRLRLSIGVSKELISVRSDWTGEIALRETLTRCHIEPRPGIKASFDRLRRGIIPLDPVKTLAQHNIQHNDILDLSGDLHIIDPSLPAELYVSLSDYTKIRTLGSGAFGDVYLYEDSRTHEEVAVKLMSVWDPLTRHFLDLVREVDIMHRANHHCVLGIKGIVDPGGDAGKPAIIMPFMVNNSVSSVIERVRKTPVPEWTYTRKYIVCYGVACGMAALHALGVIHRDLKPENVLLDENFDPKVTDFGLSKVMTEGATVEQSHHGGTISYMAPEVLLGDPFYTQAVDVYSYAISIFVILTGLEPYPKAVTPYVHTRHVTIDKKRPAIPPGFNAKVAELMRRCWDHSADLRPRFEDIVADMETAPLLEGVNAEQFEAFRERIRLGTKARVVAPEPEPEPEPSPIELLRGQVETGDVDAMLRLAQALQTGEGVEANPVEALALLRRADDLGSQEAKLAHGLALLERGESGAEKLEGMERLVRLSNDPGVPAAISLEATYQLGLVHWYGREVKVATPIRAAECFRRAAEGGHPEAEQHYAMCLDQGNGCNPDFALACEFYQRSAAHASPRGMFRYARMLLLGDGVPPNVNEGVRLFEHSAQHGCDDAYFYLWGLFSGGFGGAVAPDPVRAERYARIGAERGVVGCELEYADLLPPGPDADRFRAHAIALGRIDAQIDAGRLYEEGRVFPANIERARRLYEAATQNGSSKGAFELGKLLIEKFGLVDEAARVLRACTAVPALLYLAQKIRDGTVAALSPTEERDLTQKAKNQRSPEASVALGQMYVKERTFGKAKREFEIARNGGNADGSEWLAKCYQEGWGVSVNLARAQELLEEARVRRERDAARRRGEAAPGLARSGVVAPK